MKSKRLQKLNDIIGEKEKIFIFGTGRNAPQMSNLLLENYDVTISAFVDNDSSKWGNEYLGCRIISPENLKKEITSADVIFLSMSAYEEVEIQLRQMGIEQTAIVTNPAFWDMNAEESIIKLKEREKYNSGPIKVGFLTQEIQSWDKTAPIYEAMNKSDKYIPMLFVAPIMNYKTIELTSESHLVLYEKMYPQDRIYYVDEETEMSDYQLDYLFITAPYDCYYPEKLRSYYLVEHVLLCYIPYGYNGAYNFIHNNTKREFFRNIYITFTDTKEIKEQLSKYFRGSVTRGNRKLLDVGYPSLERILLKCDDGENEGAIMWTPRWSYDSEIGGSHFFEYYDFMCGIKKLYPGRKLIFRPHPMMFDSFLRNGMMDENDMENYKEQIAERGIILDEDSDLNTSLENTDILITDFSTLIMQFFMTGKPIIYCVSETIYLNQDYTKLMEGIYTAKKECEIREALCEIIEKGDPLKEKREEIRSEFYHKFKGSVNRILQAIEDDFLNQV